MTADTEKPTERLAAALIKYAPTNMADGPDDIAYLVKEMIEWEQSVGSELDREIVAYYLWTMGASLSHKKCIADEDGSYECVCGPCNVYLRAVADAILEARS